MCNQGYHGAYIFAVSLMENYDIIMKNLLAWTVFLLTALTDVLSSTFSLIEMHAESFVHIIFCF